MLYQLKRLLSVKPNAAPISSGVYGNVLLIFNAEINTLTSINGEKDLLIEDY
jgi:hypothetical protein